MHSLTKSSPILTPISVLHEELLWRIFMENADFPDDYMRWRINHLQVRPLIVARRCSQVCRRWRYILLSSSSIWRRMIDMDALIYRPETYWKEEVLSRAGQAPLWVYGTMKRCHAPDFLFFIQSNWHRLQALTIFEPFSEPWVLLPQQRQMLWECLKAPAPNLQRIHIQLYDSTTAVPKSYPFFSDHAPVLNEFHILSRPYKFSHTAPWARTISTVTFVKSLFTTEEILQALKYMPQLGHLIVEDRGIPAGDTLEISPIHLPHLKTLTLSTVGLLEATIILKSIVPSPGCCLNVYLAYHSFSTPEFEHYQRASIKHVISYYSLYPPSVLELKFPGKTNCIVLADGALPCGNRERFFIPVFAGVAPDFPNSSPVLQELIQEGNPSHTKELKLDGFLGAAEGARELLTRLSAMNFFSSITTLAITEYILAQLLKRTFFTDEFLPKLSILKILRDESCPRLDCEGYAPYHPFIKRRRTMGLPISVLELHFLPNHDAAYLEEHTGLVVRCICCGGDQPEYRCGDGHPDRLNFATLSEQRLIKPTPLYFFFCQPDSESASP
ncbi:hypothetical protein D9613_010899 [Agrocybe pediades]|uniref:F-box domain-containing protein n=1 Tax=Agrocybe pediades TaxID=84607 RepID=A0A8H4VM58_9AGAR|nr:hypothetical protein D9613_010899 [Agrocybe pediades]